MNFLLSMELVKLFAGPVGRIKIYSAVPSSSLLRVPLCVSSQQCARVCQHESAKTGAAKDSGPKREG